MALHTVAEYKDSVAGILSGIDLTNVDDLDGALERAASTLVQKADVPEACGLQNVVLYSGVFDYPCDTRIFGTAINDIRPQGISRNPWDTVEKMYGDDFDRTKGWLPSGTRATFQYDAGVPIIRIVASFPTQALIIDPMNQIGNWVAAGSASSLAVDTTVFYQSPASLRFTLTGSSSGTLTETLNSQLDMSSYEDVGVAFLAIRIPDTATSTNLTSVSLKLGSSSGNYNSVTNTAGFLGAWESGNWLLVAFDFATASQVGTPDWSEIDYVQITFAHTATLTNFRVGGLWISLPSPAQILYQSAAIFKASGSPTTTTITDDDDTIILNDPAYNIYLFEGALAILQNTGASASDATSVKLNQILDGNGSTSTGLYKLFMGDNPSQELRTLGSYYDGSSYGSAGGGAGGITN